MDRNCWHKIVSKSQRTEATPTYETQPNLNWLKLEISETQINTYVIAKPESSMEKHMFINIEHPHVSDDSTFIQLKKKKKKHLF